MADGAYSLETTGLTSQDQAFTNALYVHPSDFVKLAEVAGVDAERVKEAGVLCAVGEAVFFVRQSPTYKPGTIGAGMFQRVSGQLLQNKPTPVTPFFPPRGNFPLASLVAEVDLLGGAPAAGQVGCCTACNAPASGGGPCKCRHPHSPLPLAVCYHRQGRACKAPPDGVPQARVQGRSADRHQLQGHCKDQGDAARVQVPRARRGGVGRRRPAHRPVPQGDGRRAAQQEPRDQVRGLLGWQGKPGLQVGLQFP